VDFVHPYLKLCQHAKERPNAPAFEARRIRNVVYDQFQEVSWASALKAVQQYSNYLRHQNLKSGDRIAIMGKNQVDWVLLDFAIMAAGFVSVPLYPQSSEEDIRYILNEAKVKLVFSDTPVENVLVPTVLFSDLEVQSEKYGNQDFVPSPRPADEIATIIYTSGTTGTPKGVVFSSRAIQLSVEAAIKVIRMDDRDRMLSYLPLSHVAERCLCEFGALYAGARVYFLEQIEKLPKVLPLVRPTIFFAVPRVWEMICIKLHRELESSSSALVHWLSRSPRFLQRYILGRIIPKKLGLQDSRWLVSGAAKLSPETAKDLSGFGLDIREAYGLTETFGVSTFNWMNPIKQGSVGKPFPGVKLKLGEDGEVCLKSDFLFLSYYKQEKNTNAVLKNAWFHTGDIGKLDRRGRLSITDRKKDIFKISSGKYVAPLPIEAKLRNHPSIQEILVTGDERPYCVAIVALQNSEVSVKELEVLLDRVNSHLPPHEKVHSLACTFKPWTVAGGELTPTLKLKRRFILKQYQDKIQELYLKRSKIEFLDEPIVEKIKSAHSGVQ